MGPRAAGAQALLPRPAERGPAPVLPLNRGRHAWDPQSPIRPPHAIALDCPAIQSRQSWAVAIMHTLNIGDVTITSIIERDGPWRRPEDMFPDYDPERGRSYLAAMDPEVFDHASGRM